MLRTWWSLVLLAMVVFGAGQVCAAQGGGRGGGMRSMPRTVDQIKERLGADNAMTEEQQKKVEAVNAEFAKKMEEAKKKAGVAEAQAELEKATEREARTEAYKKLSEAMGFNARDEYKKVLATALNEAQVTKLFTFGGRGGPKKAE